MQTIEIVVYMAAAVLIGGLIVVVTNNTDYLGFYRDNARVLKGEEDKVFKISSSQLALELAKRWQECRLGLDNISYPVYIMDNSTITREFLVDELLRTDQCNLIDCRNRTNSFFVAPNLTTPKIINIACFNYTLIVR